MDPSFLDGDLQWAAWRERNTRGTAKWPMRPENEMGARQQSLGHKRHAVKRGRARHFGFSTVAYLRSAGTNEMQLLGTVIAPQTERVWDFGRHQPSLRRAHRLRYERPIWRNQPWRNVTCAGMSTTRRLPSRW